MERKQAIGAALDKLAIKEAQAQARIAELEREMKAAEADRDGHMHNAEIARAERDEAMNARRAVEADRDKWLEILAGMRCECGVYPAPCGPCQARKEEG